MSPRAHAIRTGAARGWTEFRHSLRAPDDLSFYLLAGVGMLVFLYLNRDSQVQGTDLTFPVVAMPGILAVTVLFGGVVGTAYSLALEREDGTLLRAKSAPHGMVGYMTGQVVQQSLGLLPMLLVLLAPSAFLFDGLMHRGAVGWAVVCGLLLLGLLISIPIGAVIGSLARKPSQVNIWAFVPVAGLAGISGVLFPIAVLWGWVQGLAQALPMYWMGMAMRWAFLPDAAQAAELGGEWRIGVGLAVMAAWAALGVAVAPAVLRRMARRESGSMVEARREERMQRVG